MLMNWKGFVYDSYEKAVQYPQADYYNKLEKFPLVVRTENSIRSCVSLIDAWGRSTCRSWHAMDTYPNVVYQVKVQERLLRNMSKDFVLFPRASDYQVDVLGNFSQIIDTPYFRDHFSGHIILEGMHGTLAYPSRHKTFYVGAFVDGLGFNQSLKLWFSTENKSPMDIILGKTIIELIKRQISPSTVTYLQCGAGKASQGIISRLKISVDMEARKQNLPPYLLRGVQHFFEKARVNLVSPNQSLGYVTDTLPRVWGYKLDPNYRELYFRNYFSGFNQRDDFVGEMSHKETADFLVSGEIYVDNPLFKSFSLNERDVSRTVFRENLYFLLGYDAIQDKWRKEYRDKKGDELWHLYQDTLETIIHKIREELGIMLPIHVKRIDGKALLLNKENIICIHPILLYVVFQWSEDDDKRNSILEMFIKHEMLQIQYREKRIFSNCNDFELASLVDMFKECYRDEEDAFKKFLSFMFFSQSQDKKDFDSLLCHIKKHNDCICDKYQEKNLILKLRSKINSSHFICSA